MEIWKPVKDYEGIYEVSNLGNVKSLVKWRGEIGRILKGGFDIYGYHIIILCKNGHRKTRSVHQLVAEVFLNHNPCNYELVINHKDFNPSNNRVKNLEIITQRENANLKHIKSSSKFVGVCWRKDTNKWRSSIWIKGKTKILGCFINEIDAHNAYHNALKNI